MSYDLVIATHREPRTLDVEEALAAKASIEGGLGARSNLLVRAARWEFTIDGPFQVDVEHLQGRLAAAVLAPRWLVQIHVPVRTPEIARRTATRIATSLAKSCAGAVYDPQEDRVLYPRSGRRPRPARTTEERTRRLEFEWAYAPQKLAHVAEAFIGVIRARLPEATPTNYGTFEPHTNRYMDDPAGFIELWRSVSKNSGTFFWNCKRPAVGGSASWPADNRANAELGGVAAAQLHLELEGDPLIGDLQWREALRDFFQSVAIRTGAFYARALLSPPKPRRITAGEVYDLLLPASVFRGRWHGIPRQPAWLTWLGEAYRAHGIAAGPTPAEVGAGESETLLVDDTNLTSALRLHASIPSALYRRQAGGRSPAGIERLSAETEFIEAPLHFDPSGS